MLSAKGCGWRRIELGGPGMMKSLGRSGERILGFQSILEVAFPHTPCGPGHPTPEEPVSPFPPSARRKHPEMPRSLAERVEYHVAQTALRLDRVRRARRPLGERGRRTQATVGDLQQASLRAVFLELGDTHRAYRARTGQAGTADLRAAAHAFKRTPTLPALVTVAGFFDELGLLEW